MMDDHLGDNSRLERLGAWSGIAWVLFAGSSCVIAGLIPEYSPSQRR